MIKKMLGCFLLAFAISCSPKIGSTPVVESIKMMSYNVHHCNPPSKPGVIDLEAIVKVIKKEQPDIVALQEIDVNTKRSGQLNQAQRIASGAGYHAFYFAKSIDHDGGDYGVMILSRFPLSDMQTHRLPTDPATKGEPRVLAMATATLPDGRRLKVASTHLDYGKNNNGLLQMREINRLLQDEALPLLIGGDFNAAEQSKVIKTLDEQFTRTCSSCRFTSPSDTPRTTIDYLAFRKKNDFTVLSHKVIPESYASDHAPVIAALKLNF